MQHGAPSRLAVSIAEPRDSRELPATLDCLTGPLRSHAQRLVDELWRSAAKHREGLQCPQFTFSLPHLIGQPESALSADTRQTKWPSLRCGDAVRRAGVSGSDNCLIE